MFYLTYLWSFLTQRKKTHGNGFMPNHTATRILWSKYNLHAILRIFRKYLKFKKISTSQEAFISYCLSDSYYAQKYKAHILK